MSRIDFTRNTLGELRQIAHDMHVRMSAFTPRSVLQDAIQARHDAICRVEARADGGRAEATRQAWLLVTPVQLEARP